MSEVYTSQGTDDAANEAAGHGELDLDDEALELDIAAGQSGERDNEDEDTDPIEVDGDDDDGDDEPAEEVELDEPDDDTDDADDKDDDEDEGDEPEDSERFESVSQLSTDDDIQYAIEYHDEQRRQAEFLLDNARQADSAFLKEIGLKHFPYTSGGKSLNVYTMDDVEFDSFIDRLEEHDSIRKSDVRDVVRARAKYQARMEQMEQQSLHQLSVIDSSEWQLISQRAPKFVADNEQQIADIIRKKLESDPIIQKRATTFKGKLYLLNQAIKELKLGKKADKKKTERPKPNIHKSKSRGKTQRNNAPLQFRTRDEFRQWMKNLDPEEALSDKYTNVIARYSKKFATKK